MWSINFFCVLLALGSIQAESKTNNHLEGVSSSDPYYEEIGALMERKLARNFGVLQLGGGYGIAKRLSLSRNNGQEKNEKQRRGPLNGLIPGGAFGRAARSNNCIRTNCQRFIYDKVVKLVKEPMDAEIQPYVSFDVENRKGSNDGQGMKAFIDKGLQEDMASIDAYTPYQYSK